MKIYSLSSLFFISISGILQAELVSDPFLTGPNPAAGDYTVGSNVLAGQDPTVAGWTGVWQAVTGNGTVLPTGLEYDGLITSGGAIATQSNARFGRNLTQVFYDATTGVYYLSVLLRVEDNINNYRSFELHQDVINDSSRTLQISVGEASTSNYTFTVLNDAVSRVDLGAGDNAINLFVIKFEFSDAASSDSVTIWRNPENIASEAGSTIDGFIDGVDMTFNITSLARFNSGGGIVMDELRIGSSWSEVLPSNMATTWAGYDIDSNNLVDTGDWIGVIYLADDWIYCYDLGTWLYLPESQVTLDGAWSFAP